jgi:hypothetical protein
VLRSFRHSGPAPARKVGTVCWVACDDLCRADVQSDRGDPGVGDHDIVAPERGDGLFDGGGDRFGVAAVGADGERGLRTDVANESLGTLGVLV